MNDNPRLTSDLAAAKAAECRDMAKRTYIDAHRIMLEHMAETWDRIAQDLARTNGHAK